MMLNNMNISTMPFEKAIKVKLWMSVLVTIIGVTTFIIMLTNLSGNYQSIMNEQDRSLISGFYTGIGSGLTVSGIITFIKSVLFLKNKDRFKKAEIEYNDERNRLIISKTFAMTTYIALFALLIAVVVTGMINVTVFATLLFALGAYGLALLISYIVVKARN